MKNVVLIAFVAMLALTPLYPALAVDTAGNHTGEARDLSYTIEYLDPLGETEANELGLFFRPFAGGVLFLPIILPSRYFGIYPLYFNSNTMRFRVHLKNTGKRTFRNLDVIASQEFLNSDGGAGAEMSPNVKSAWHVPVLAPGKAVALGGSFLIPNTESSGLDQTHLWILHGSAHEERVDDAPGRIIVDDPQAGIWCPVL